MIAPATYFDFIRSRQSRPSVGEWVPYDENLLRDDTTPVEMRSADRILLLASTDLTFTRPRRW